MHQAPLVGMSSPGHFDKFKNNQESLGKSIKLSRVGLAPRVEGDFA